MSRKTKRTRPPSYYRHKAKRNAAKVLAKINQVEPICNECGTLAELVKGDRIYPHRPDLHWKPFYLCACGAYVGTHPGTEIPLGTPAGPKTRAARNAAHDVFDALWRRKMVRDGVSKGVAREAAYAWLAQEMQIDPLMVHIALMTVEQCARVVAICGHHQRRTAS